jgi:hypothetical protein
VNSSMDAFIGEVSTFVIQPTLDHMSLWGHFISKTYSLKVCVKRVHCWTSSVEPMSQTPRWVPPGMLESWCLRYQSTEQIILKLNLSK